MKKIFFFAMMACVAMCNTSCNSSDDDNEKPNDNNTEVGNTTVGKLEDKAAHYEIAEANAPKPKNTIKVEKSDGTEIEIVPELTSFNVTEYGQAVFEINVDGSKKYCTYNAELTESTEKKDVYTLKDNNLYKGTVTIVKEKEGAMTRATEGVELIFDMSISIELYGVMIPLRFNDTAAAQVVIETVVKTITTQITNTWTVEYMKLVISYDDPKKSAYSTDVESGDLRPFIKKAMDNGVTLNEKEQKELNRAIKSIIIDKNNLLVLNYDNGNSDAASWRWVNENPDNLAIGITLKDNEMGNKFISDNSKFGIELRQNGKVNFILTTRLESDKCNVSLIVNLK